MMDLHIPCVLVVSDFTDPEVLTSQFFHNQSFPKSHYIGGNIKAFPWKIDTKYYQATVNLCPVKSEIIIPESIYYLTEALVVYFDSKNINSFNNIKNWVENAKDNLPEILILVCDTFNNTSPRGISQCNVQNWCLDNSFELITLNDVEINENTDYNIIPDKYGMDRIIEALHAHIWPNLDMKKVTDHLKNSSIDSPSMDEDVFCQLLSKLNSVKESISSLSQNDRRACAEQVVSTFWKTIGGKDDDEIDDSDM